jgi:hypothetical protein
VRAERGAQRVQRPEGVGALAVEHRHEDEPRQVELGGALPQAQRRRLDAHDGVHDEDRGLADPQRAERVGDEARLPRRVQEVDLPLAPGERRQRRGDRHLPCSLVRIRVRRRGPVRDPPETVDRPGLEEERLVQRRLPAATVADQGDVADPIRGLGHARDSSRGKRGGRRP